MTAVAADLASAAPYVDRNAVPWVSAKRGPLMVVPFRFARRRAALFFATSRGVRGGQCRLRLRRTCFQVAPTTAGRLRDAAWRWSGWVYAYRTFWVDPGADWDEEKTAEFLEIGGTEHPR